MVRWWGLYSMLHHRLRSVNIGGRGVFGGGYIGSTTNGISYITISSTGNASDFGDLTLARDNLGAASNGINNRGIFCGGGNDNGTVYYNNIDYITISSTGNASDFGDLGVSSITNGTSNGINDRGVFAGISNTYGESSTRIDYITISSTGNASNFGDLTTAREVLGATSNGTNNRGVFGGGALPSQYYLNVIDYITISSTGNASDFGDLSSRITNLCGTSNGINNRGIFAGGYITTPAYINVISYITISSTGNASDFGDLTQTVAAVSATSNGTNDRGVFGGGTTGSRTNVISYITISSTGNASDFGDLLNNTSHLAATSNS